MTRKEEFETIVKICERAEKMGVSASDRMTLLMDLENAHKTVGLHLEGLLAAEDFNFAHDIIGIQNNMNRSTGQLENFFSPRYAKQYHVSEILADAERRAKEQGGNASVKDEVAKEM